MTRRRIRHRVERTRNKHSRAVFREGTIVIRLARNLSKTEQQIHVRDLLRRMTQQVLEEEEKTTIDPFRSIFRGAESLTVTSSTGKKYFFTMKPGVKTIARRTSRGWSVTVGPHIKRKGLHSFLWRLLSMSEEKRVRLLVHEINDTSFCHPLRKIRLKFASSQWGSCSPRKTIMFNTALLFAPPSVLKYVIVHELAHLKHSNHSSAYWREVEYAMPQYKRARELLKEYRLPSL